MSGMTKADYKKQAEDLAEKLAHVNELNVQFKAQAFKLEADRVELIHENKALENERHALRRQLRMMGDWIAEALE